MREEPQRIAGRLEGTLRIPDLDPTAIVVIAHPLPTHGGTMRNPLMATLARAAADRGWYALRFNFRGVGASAGEWTGGQEEDKDVADAATHARALAPHVPLGVVGFSFGARMLARWLTQGGRPDAFVFMGLPLRSATRELEAPVPIPRGSTIVNGANDEFARPDELRQTYRDAHVIAIPGTDHFFTGKRDEVARVVMDQLALTVP